jgi:hypothetical protein
MLSEEDTLDFAVDFKVEGEGGHSLGSKGTQGAGGVERQGQCVGMGVEMNVKVTTRHHTAINYAYIYTMIFQNSRLLCHSSKTSGPRRFARFARRRRVPRVLR